MPALDLLPLAQTAAARAGGYLRSVQRPADPSSWTLKGSRDFVTEVDREAVAPGSVTSASAIHAWLLETLKS